MVLEGQPVADKIYSDLKKDLENTKAPTLGVILVGENIASKIYVREKEEISRKLGIGFKLFDLPEETSQEEAFHLINLLNHDEEITGFLIQLPLPKSLDRDSLIAQIDPKKDVDGFRGQIASPTAQAIYEMLNYYKINLSEKRIVIVGHGLLVGEPLERLLKEKGFNPIICDSKTDELKETTQGADILISATGVAGLIKEDMVKEDAIVIDAGTAEANGKIGGDVDKAVYNKVQSYSPVPGGVGPVTVASLMKSLVELSNENL